MRGMIFTLDAIIAFGIIVAIITGFVFFRTETVSPYLTAQKLHSVSEDILGVLFNSKLKDVVNNTLLQQYIADGTLEESDLDKKTTDVIGALWSNQTKQEEVANIIKDVLENFIPNNTGYQILINNDDVYNSSDTSRPAYDDSSIRISSARIISGYEKYKPVSGFVARAWATKIKKVTTKLIPINLAWGGYADSRYDFNGYGPDGVRDMWSIIIKNFTIADDANITYAYMQIAYDNRYTDITINGNPVDGGPGVVSPGSIEEYNITDLVAPGINIVNVTFKRNENVDLAHFHPGCYIKIKYNTSEVESGSNKTIFNADWMMGAPSAIQIIPFFVNAPINNVTAFIDIRDINAFLLLTLNYRYNASNPIQNVLLYRNYITDSTCSDLTDSGECTACGCSWIGGTEEDIIFWHGFEDMGCEGGNCFNTTVWDPIERGNDGNEARVQNDNRHSGTYAAELEEGDEGEVAISTVAGLINITGYDSCTLKLWAQFMDSWESDDDVYIDIYDGSWNYGAFKIDVNENNYDDAQWREFSFDIDSSVYVFDENFRLRIDHEASTDEEEAHYDDINLTCSYNPCTGIASDCEYLEEAVKNRSYELFFNETGTLIKEYNTSDGAPEGTILNTWFNTNVTFNDIHNDMTNSLGIYADIRAPENETIIISDEDPMDWQRLGMFAHNDTNMAINQGDYQCFITEKTNVTVYHDIERYGLEYGKIDISVIENFTDEIKSCISNNCKDANLNLTFPFQTSILKATVLGTQKWAGNDNGYNFIWMWINETEPEEAHMVLDTDTPPGTFTILPVQFLQTNRINIIRVGDKSTGERELNTDPTTYMDHKRSIVEYAFLIPSQVGYGDVFENDTDAINDAEIRLNQTLGSFASATIIQRDSFRVGGVPYMYGPFSFRVNVWV